MCVRLSRRVLRDCAVFCLLYCCFLLDYTSTLLLLLFGGGERNIIVLSLFRTLGLSPATPPLIAAFSSVVAYLGYVLSRRVERRLGGRIPLSKVYLGVVCGGELFMVMHNTVLLLHVTAVALHVQLFHTSSCRIQSL